MQAETLVIGGGLAGPALAIALARAGREVVLVEKEKAAHHKVCGEFLSREAVHYLEALGIDLAKLGAVAIDRVRLVCRQGVTDVALPFQARSLSRKSLDEALIRQAEASGVLVRQGWQAQGLRCVENGWCVKSSQDSIEAQTVFLATGKHDLRDWKRPPGSQNDLIAFKQYWRLSAGQTEALSRAVELILFRGGYAGLELVENGVANLCLLVRRRHYERVGSSWAALLSSICEGSPHLSRRLEGAQSLWPRPLALAAIPYGHVRRRGQDGLWRLGDQSAVIPSFAGDGMSIALHSARLAADHFLAGANADDYQRALCRHARSPVRLATLLSQIMVRPWGQTVLAGASRLLPHLVQATVGGTRLPWRYVTA
jgi:flavin-dependent dehydrogenase